ncbi:hypothetical protein D3C73_1463340 [compost metagenome]
MLQTALLHALRRIADDLHTIDRKIALTGDAVDHVKDIDGPVLTPYSGCILRLLEQPHGRQAL